MKNTLYHAQAFSNQINDLREVWLLATRMSLSLSIAIYTFYAQNTCRETNFVESNHRSQAFNQTGCNNILIIMPLVSIALRSVVHTSKLDTILKATVLIYVLYLCAYSSKLKQTSCHILKLPFWIQSNAFRNIQLSSEGSKGWSWSDLLHGK